MLLADPDGKAERAFAVKRTLGLIKGRTTFVIDREGVVRHVFNSQLRPTAHIGEALAVVQKLAAGG